MEGRDLSSRRTQHAARDLEIGQPINSEKCSEAADGVAREGEGRSRVSLLRPVRQDQPRGHPGACLCPVPLDPRLVAIYEDRCAACHTYSGAGVATLFPRLASAPLVQSIDPTSLIRVVLMGSRAAATSAAPTAPAMPAFGWNLNDTEIADVLTYVRNTWGNAAPTVQPEDVSKLRGPAHGDPQRGEANRARRRFVVQNTQRRGECVMRSRPNVGSC